MKCSKCGQDDDSAMLETIQRQREVIQKLRESVEFCLEWAGDNEPPRRLQHDVYTQLKQCLSELENK